METTAGPVRVGLLGLGDMGVAMARRIVEAGHSICVYDIDAKKLADFPDALPAECPASLAEWSEVVIASMPDEASLLSVLMPPKGLLASLANQAVLVDSSPVSPATSAFMRATQAGPDRYLAAPVLGNSESAATGSLICLCSGAADAFFRARPVIGCFARSVVRVGDAEQARVLKLAISHITGSLAQVVLEALTLAKKAGVGSQLLAETLESSGPGRPLFLHIADLLSRRDVTTTFTARQMHEQMALLAAVGDGFGVDVPIARLVRDLLAREASGGSTEPDFFTAVLERERLAGPGEQA